MSNGKGTSKRTRRSMHQAERARREANRRRDAAARKPPPTYGEQRDKIAHEAGIDDPRFAAAVDLIGRTGAQSFAIRYQDDEKPVVWMALAEHNVGDDGVPVRTGGRKAWMVAADFTPLAAVLALAERLIDGGVCAWCARPAGLDPDTLDTMPLDDLVCWWQFDPELRVFRRGCEGDVDEKQIKVGGR